MLADEQQHRGIRLLIVQHVQANTAPGAVPGDIGLTPHGYRQAVAVATRLAADIAPTQLREIVSNGATGAVRTADLIAEAFGTTVSTGIGVADRGREELWPDYSARAGGDVEAVLARHRGRPGVVVTVCDAAWTSAAGQYLNHTPATLDSAVAELDPASITEWRHIGGNQSNRRGRWLCVRHNDNAHNAYQQ